MQTHFLSLWNSEVHRGPHWRAMKGSVGLHSFWRCWGRMSPCFFQLLGITCFLWLMILPTIFKGDKVASPGTSRIQAPVPPPSSTLKDPCDYVNPEQHPCFKAIWKANLIISAALIPRCHVTYHRCNFSALGCDNFESPFILSTAEEK